LADDVVEYENGSGPLIGERPRRLEIAMPEPTPFGRAGENSFLLILILVQRIVKPGDHPRGIAEGGMLGDVLDALTIDPDLRPSSRLSRYSLPVYGSNGALVSEQSW
jgi:hypothetical protein